MSGAKRKIVGVIRSSVPAELPKREGWGGQGMMHRIAGMALVVLCLVCAGCGGEFDETKMRLTTEQVPIHLDSEQVSLTEQQVNCGVDKDLWDPPVRVSVRSVARLHQEARNLGFSDDVQVGEPGYALPYAQMRGDFMLRVESLLDTKDGPGQGVKTVSALVRVKVPNDCFAGDLPIMGVRKGQFNPNIPVTLIFTFENSDWKLDHFVH